MCRWDKLGFSAKVVLSNECDRFSNTILKCFWRKERFEDKPAVSVSAEESLRVGLTTFA